MELQIKDKTFDFDCRLRACVRIKGKFGKNFQEIIEDLDKMSVDQLIDLLYCGINKDEYTSSDFRNYLLDNCGMADLYDAVSWFIKQLQYPGLSEEEIEKKLLEKKAKAEALRK